MEENIKTAVEQAGLRLKLGGIDSWEQTLPVDEVLWRVDRLGEYLRQANVFNADGVALTPVVLQYLQPPGDFDRLLGELDRLRIETRSGRFDPTNPLQRDLEFTKFRWKKAASADAPRSDEVLYEEFSKLPVLQPAEQPETFSLTGRHLKEAKRAAFEAVGFLRFLREFRKRTTRRIVVVANDKAQYWGGGYGRMFVVEPLEEHLNAEFAIRYERVPSHGTMRLNVPSAFPKDFVKELCADMPHIVIVDGAGSPKASYTTRFSRAVRGYANWFAVLNDLRSGGRHELYEADTPLPAEHLAEMRKWDDYVLVREEVEEWVDPGPTYSVAMWAPEPAEKTLLADVEVVWRDADPDSDRPFVVLANPIVYRSDVEDPGRHIGTLDGPLKKPLSGTRPYYFDRADKDVKERIVLGFGPHGLETRVDGPTTRSFIKVVQRQIKEEIAVLRGED